MECPDCGAHIGDEDRFCGECGRPVENAPAASADRGPAVASVPRATIPAPPRPPAVPIAHAATVPAATALARRRGLMLGVLGVSAALMALCVAAGIIFVALGSEDPPTSTPEFVPIRHAPGALAYSEQFETDDGAWDVYDAEDTWAAYVDGGYRLGVHVAEYVTWANPTWDESFANFEIEVDVRQVEGPIDNNAGVLVRYQADDENYYWFQVSNDGFYSVSIMRDGEWDTLVDWETADAIQVGLDVVNRVRVVCYRDEFDLYVNDTYLTSVVDDTFATGTVGLAAGTFDEPGVVVEFDNLTIRLLEE